MGADDSATGTGRKLIHEELTGQIIGAAIEVHRVLGPGVLESVYERALCHELALRKLSFERQIAMPLQYKGIELEGGYRLDIVVEQKVILELKSIAQILPVHEAQLLTYMRLTNKPVGLIINFNVPVLKHGIVRRVL